MVSLPVLVLLTVSLSGAQERDRPAALDAMIATERAFAATASRVGVRASFLRYFSDSCIAFNPAPYRWRAAVAKAPPQPNPLRWTLVWEPVAGDVSASGDLGFLMGPSVLVDTESPDAPPGYGFYFSVWALQSDSTWKVVLDIGTEATAHILRFRGSDFIRLYAEPSGATGSETRASPGVTIGGQDSLMSVAAERVGMREAYGVVLEERARVLREGIGPVCGRDSILAFLNHDAALLEWVPSGGGIAAAGDVSFTYGTCRAESGAATGYYARIWRKDQAGGWKLAVDIMKPAQEE